MMADVNQRLAERGDFFESLRSATEALVTKRNELDALGPTDHPGGGPERIKCLHAHAAHFLASRDNPVGEETLAALQWEDPKNPCV